jgi:hypothetical protein
MEEWYCTTHAEIFEIVDTMVERIRAVIAANEFDSRPKFP